MNSEKTSAMYPYKDSWRLLSVMDMFFVTAMYDDYILSHILTENLALVFFQNL